MVLALNEERNLPDCLASLAGWVERMVVVDSGSTDRTKGIAAEFGADVVEHPFVNYGAQRNWALEQLNISTPWVLNIDADERVSPELKESIEQAVGAGGGNVAGYLMTRRTMFLGRWIRHGGHYPVWHLRLFRLGAGRCEDRLYDQHFIVNGEVARLDGDLIDVLTTDVATFVSRHVRWAKLEAQELLSVPSPGSRVSGSLKSSNPIEFRRGLREIYQRLPLFVRPALYFGYRYFVRAGFLDGREGLIFHSVQGFFYRFLVDALVFEALRKKSDRSESTRRREA